MRRHVGAGDYPSRASRGIMTDPHRSDYILDAADVEIDAFLAAKINIRATNPAEGGAFKAKDRVMRTLRYLLSM